MDTLHDHDDRGVVCGPARPDGVRQPPVRRLALGLAPRILRLDGVVDDDGAGKALLHEPGAKARHLPAGGRGVDAAGSPPPALDVPPLLGLGVPTERQRPKLLKSLRFQYLTG